MCQDRPAIKGLPAEFRPALEEAVEARVVGIDFSAQGVGNLRAQQVRLGAAPLQDQFGFVLGAFFKDGQDVADVGLLVFEKLRVGEEEIGNDFVRGGDDAAFVGRSVAHDEDAAPLQLQSRFRGQKGVGPLDDDLGGGGAVGAEELFPVLLVDRLRPAAGGDEEVGANGKDQLGIGAGEVVDGDPLFDETGAGHRHLAVKILKPVAARTGTEEEEAAGVEALRVEGIEIVLEDEPLQLGMVGAKGIEKGGSAIEDEADGDLRRAVEEEAQGIAGHVAIRAAGEFERIGIAVDIDPDLAHGDLGELHHPGRGDAILLVVDADLFARHDADTEEVAAAAREIGNRLDHFVMHVFVRAEFDRLLLPVVIDNSRMFGHPLHGDEEIEKGVGDPVLQFVEAPGLHDPLLGGEVGRVEEGDELGTPFVDILVLEMLGVCQDEVLAKKGLGVGDIVILAAGDYRSPAAAGDIGEADVVAEAEAVVEEGDAEGGGLGQVGDRLAREFIQVSRVETEGEGLLFEDKEVGLEGVADKGEGTAKDGAADLVEMAVAGVELGDGAARRCQELLVAAVARHDRRLKALAKEGRQLQGDLRVGEEGIPHLGEFEMVGAAVGETGVAKGNESIDQGGVIAAHGVVANKGVVEDALGREELGVGQLPLQADEELIAGTELAAVAALDIESGEKVGVNAVADRQAVGAIDAEFEAVEDLHDLQEKVALRRVADGKVHPRFVTVAVRFDIEIEAVVPVPHVKDVEDLGDAQHRRVAQVPLVVDPEEAQQMVEGV